MENKNETEIDMSDESNVSVFPYNDQMNKLKKENDMFRLCIGHIVEWEKKQKRLSTDSKMELLNIISSHME